MPPAIIAAGIGAAGAIGGGILANKGASKAAKATVQASNQAGAIQQQTYGQSAQPYAGQYGAAPAYGGYPAAAKTNGLAVVSLVSSLVGIFVIPFIGSIVGIITGHMSLGQIKRTGENGRGLALAGTIIGYVGVALAIIGIIVFFAWISWFTANAGSFRTA